MPKITLDNPWSYISHQFSVDYLPGEHNVSTPIAEAYAATQPKEQDDGDNGPAKAGAARGAAKAGG